MSLLRRALGLQRGLLGEDHPEVPETLSGLGYAVMRQGNHAEAERVLREALAMQRKLLGDEHPDVAETLSELASVMRSQGDYAEAERMYCNALRMQRVLFGAEHPGVAKTLNALGSTMKALGNHADAERAYREALTMQRSLFGDNHQSTARTLYNLACLEAVNEHRTQAMSWLRQSVHAGWKYADWMEQDADLASLRGDPEFEAIVTDVRRRNEEDREESEKVNTP